MTPQRFAIGACALLAVSLAAQTTSTPSASQPPRGDLIVWIIHPVPAPWVTQKAASAPSPTAMPDQTAGSYGQTAGSFGQSAGSYGQTAGSYGQPSSNVGRNASDTGQTAGSYGRTPSTFGRSASNVGQTAGSYGTTAGSFGESLSTINDAAPRLERAAADAYHHPPHDSRWTNWIQSARNTFPELHLTTVDIREDELQSSLDAAHGTAAAPDIVVGAPLPLSWRHPDTGLLRSYGLVTLGGHFTLIQTEASPSGVLIRSQPWQPEASILLTAPHPEAARALVAWLLDGRPCVHCRVAQETADRTPARIAASALSDLLEGRGAGADADPDLARFDPQFAQLQALNSFPVPDRLTVHVDVLDAASNGRLSVVRLRAVLSAPQAFGVLEAVAVLRRDPQDQWRVLHVTPNLSGEQTTQAYSMLSPFARGGHVEQVAGVSLAAPLDGDNRGPQPELSWDNHGGAGLQVIEWQVSPGPHSPVSHLFFVPDREMHLRTSVNASFATAASVYRWRVWSIGYGGALILSPWRTLNIVP